MDTLINWTNNNSTSILNILVLMFVMLFFYHRHLAGILKHKEVTPVSLVVAIMIGCLYNFTDVDDGQLFAVVFMLIKTVLMINIVWIELRILRGKKEINNV